MEIQHKTRRTAWSVEALADWLHKYDKIHKLGSDRAPYDYETWVLIVQNVALDYAINLRREYVTSALEQLEEE